MNVECEANTEGVVFASCCKFSGKWWILSCKHVIYLFLLFACQVSSLVNVKLVSSSERLELSRFLLQVLFDPIKSPTTIHLNHSLIIHFGAGPGFSPSWLSLTRHTLTTIHWIILNTNSRCKKTTTKNAILHRCSALLLAWKEPIVDYTCYVRHVINRLIGY